MSRLDSLKDQFSPNFSAYHTLQKNVDHDKRLAQDLLDRGNAAQKVCCLARYTLKKHRHIGDFAHYTSKLQNNRRPCK